MKWSSQENLSCSSRGRTTSTRSSTSSWTVICNQTGISVKVTRKVSVKWRNWSDFKVQHSTQIRGENWSKIKILSWNFQTEYRNCKMKLTVWRIREILKMLNQFVGTFTRYQSTCVCSHLIQFGILCRSIGMPRRKDGPPSIWNTHDLSVNVFANPIASSTAPYPQEMNPWSSRTEEPLYSPTVEKSERRTQNQDQRCQSGQSAKKSVIFIGADSSEELWDRPTTTADFRSSFRQILHTSNVCLSEDKIQDWDMYLFTISYGSYTVD